MVTKQTFKVRYLNVFFFPRLQTQIIIKEYRDFENQQISSDYNPESRNHFQNDIVTINLNSKPVITNVGKCL